MRLIALFITIYFLTLGKWDRLYRIRVLIIILRVGARAGRVSALVMANIQSRLAKQWHTIVQ